MKTLIRRWAILALLAALMPSTALAADPTPKPAYSISNQSGSVPAVLPSGLDVNGAAVPCGSSTVAFGCQNPTTVTAGSSSALEASHVMKALAGTFFGAMATPTGTAGYLMVFFGVTSAPADGAVTPAFCVPVTASQSSGLSTGNVAAAFSTGAVLVFSTTGCFTKTASATVSFSWLVQ